MEAYNLVSFFGLFILLGLAWLFSTNRRNVNFRVVGWGLAIQLAFALFIFVVPAGAKVFLAVNDGVVEVLDAATAGAKFLFGPLAEAPGNEGSLGFILAFQAFPTIIFFSSLVAILYYYNILPLLIRWFAQAFTRLMHISGAESLCAASNIFVGIESSLTVRPHLGKMTRSELCTVLTAGMATVASNVLALYVFTLQAHFSTIAGHLVSASFLSAPAAIIMSKLLLPEDHRPATLGKAIRPHYEKESNVFEAVINGARGGVTVIVGISALLVAVLGLVALADLILGGVGERINGLLNMSVDWSLKGLLGYLFYPLTLALGIPVSDAGLAAQIIGERVVLTEVASYKDLAAALAANQFFHSRSPVIIAYALCGFAHVASMAIFVGGVGAIAPNKTRALSQIAFRALAAATLACLLTACVAGTFYMPGSSLLVK